MSLIDNSLESAASSIAMAGPVTGSVVDSVKTKLKDEFSKAAWNWYNLNTEKVIFSINQKILFFTAKFDVKVKHARKVFEEMAGPEPVL